MIKSVNNLSIKSFVNYSTSESISFKKNNVFFGYNGKGKSSFAKGIENEILKFEGLNEDNIRFYNSDFLQLKLINSDSKRLKGVKALFGKPNIDTEKEIEELNAKLVDKKPITDKIASLTFNIDNSVRTIEDSIRGKIKLRHSQFNEGMNIDDYISLFRNNYLSALKIVSDEKLDTYKSNIDFDTNRAEIQNGAVLDVPIIPEANIVEAGEVLAKTYSLETVPSKDLLDWVRTGINLHKEGASDHCLFCGSKTYNLENIEEQFQSYLTNTKVIDIDKINSIVNRFEETINLINEFLKYKNSLSILYENDDLENRFVMLEKCVSILQVSKTEFEVKLSSFENKINFNKINEIIDSYKKIDEIVQYFGNLKAKYLKRVDVEEQKLNDILKGLIGKRISNNKQIADFVKDYKKAVKELAECEKNNKEINEKITFLKNSVSPIGSFAVFINKILEGLEINFELQIAGNDYIIVPKNTSKEIKISDISEGEKNILSLLFFYFNLFNDDKQKNFKSEIEYIILDDPISSLDDNNHTYIISILRDIMDLKDPQIFVFTHDWDDFCKISYGCTKNEDYSFFEIKKDSSSHSFIEKTKATVSPYEHDFLELLSISEANNENSIDEDDVYHLANSIRKVLEHFLSFKTTNTSPTHSNIGSIRDVLIPNEEDRSANKERQLSTLLNVINVLSHESTRNVHEVFLSIKFIINRIKEVDKAHYNMMKNKLSTLSNS